MSTVLSAINALHLLFAGVWAGSIVFVTVGVLPLARAGDIRAEPLEAIAGRVQTISRTSAVVLLLTGGHLAGTYYTFESLRGTTPGLLVVAMVALWASLMGLVEVATKRLSDGTEQRKVRAPARESYRLFQAASIVSVALLVLGGVLVTV